MYSNENRRQGIGDINPEYAYFNIIVDDALRENPTERVKIATKFNERLKCFKILAILVDIADILQKIGNKLKKCRYFELLF